MLLLPNESAAQAISSILKSACLSSVKNSKQVQRRQILFVQTPTTHGLGSVAFQHCREEHLRMDDQVALKDDLPTAT